MRGRESERRGRWGGVGLALSVAAPPLARTRTHTPTRAPALLRRGSVSDLLTPNYPPLKVSGQVLYGFKIRIPAKVAYCEQDDVGFAPFKRSSQI